MSIKFLVLAGGTLGWRRGGGECRFYFYGREDFSEFFGTFGVFGPHAPDLAWGDNVIICSF